MFHLCNFYFTFSNVKVLVTYSIFNLQADTKPSLYITLNPTNDSVTTQTTTGGSYRKRHRRTGSGSPRSSGFGSRASSCRASVVVDAETQTDCMDVSENDLSSPTATTTPSYNKKPQRVILQQFEDPEGVNGNAVRLHYLVQHGFAQTDSRPDSPMDLEDKVNRNIDTPEVSGEENLEAITRKVSAITTYDNGNVSDNLVFRQITHDRDSTEDAANEDSFTDEEGEIYDPSLRRRR